MNQRNFLIIIIVLAVLIAAFLGWRWYNSPARQIAKTLNTMAELASSPPAEGRVAAATRAGRLADYFTAEAQVTLAETERIAAGAWRGRSQVRERALAAKVAADFTVSVADLIITTHRGAPSGAAGFTPLKSGTLTGFTLIVKEGDQIRAWLAEAVMLKLDGDWQVDNLTLSPVVRR